MDKLIKLFKPDLSDKKHKIYFGIKVVVALIYTGFMLKVFIDKGYYNIKMVNKQGLWFLTLTSLALVLSVYYITMPNELLYCLQILIYPKSKTPLLVSH